MVAADLDDLKVSAVVDVEGFGLKKFFFCILLRYASFLLHDRSVQISHSLKAQLFYGIPNSGP